MNSLKYFQAFPLNQWYVCSFLLFALFFIYVSRELFNNVDLKIVACTFVEMVNVKLKIVKPLTSVLVIIFNTKYYVMLR